MRIFRPFIVLLLVLPLSLAAVKKNMQAFSEGNGPAVVLDEFFAGQVERYGLAAIGACIVRDGKVAWSNGFGLADIEAKRPATADTLFPVGSVSKTVTLAAFMRLLEQGKCALDDDVSRYLPYPLRNPRFPDRPITLCHLLSFTSGIFDVDLQAGRNRLSFLEEERDPQTSAVAALKEFLVPGGRHYAAENFLEYPPGERYAYSNSSYSLIGAVVERLSGRPFREYCHDELFASLGMKASTWRLGDLDHRRYAFGYRREGGRLAKVQPTTWPGYMDGGLRTTPRDFGVFLAMMANRGEFQDKRVLKAKTIDQMLAPQAAPGAPAGKGLPVISRGLVWILSQAGERRVWQMNGFGPSFFAQVYFDPEKKTAGAFFTTGVFRSLDEMGRAVREMIAKLMEYEDKV